MRDFHSRCDKKGPTISLFKVKDGDCIGGFTNALWSSDNKDVGDSGAMLFNLQQQRCFPVKQQAKYAIGCWSNTGPGFTGGDYYELCARFEPFNGEGKCTSRANYSGYRIPLEGAKNMLTNKEGKLFTITELEVWEVKLIDW